MGDKLFYDMSQGVLQKKALFLHSLALLYVPSLSRYQKSFLQFDSLCFLAKFYSGKNIMYIYNLGSNWILC